MNPRARRARRIVRDRRRHYQLGHPALCPAGCLECALTLYDWNRATRFMGSLGAMIQLFDLLRTPGGPRMIREAADELRATLHAALTPVPFQPEPTPNPLQPGHMICGEVHCAPCNRLDSLPPDPDPTVPLPPVTLESGRQIQLDGYPCDRCGEMKPAHAGWALGHLYDSADDRKAWGLAMAQAEENGRRFLAERAAQEPEFCECGGPYSHVTPCDPGEEA